MYTRLLHIYIRPADQSLYYFHFTTTVGRIPNYYTQKSTDWSPIGWFLNHSTNSVVVGWSDGKTRQKGTNFKRLIDNKP